MKFKTHLDKEDFLTCSSCGNDSFDLLPEKKLSGEAKYKKFLFYGCQNCAGAGFWTHSNSIDEKLDLGIAIARCKPVGTLSAVRV